MGTIAQKLEYLNDTRLLLKDNINKINNVLDDNSTFRSYPQELFNGYLDILNNGTDTLWSNLEKVSQTGTEAVLEGVETAPMKIELSGNTSQETTTGKNLLPTQENEWEQGGISITGQNKSDTTRLRTKQYYPISNDTNYHISVQNTNYCFLNLLFYDNNKNYVGNYYDAVSNQINGATDFTINIPSASISNVAYVRATIRNADNSTINANEITTIKPQLEEGTTATSFEKYTGGIPSPNPDYPQEVKVVKGENVVSVSGKNLLNVPSTFSVTTSANITASLNAGTYTISLEDYETNVEVGSSFLFQFLKDNTLVTDAYLTMSYKKTTKAIPSEVDKIRIYASSSYNNSNGKTTTFKNLMIEQNSQATPYAPYSKTDYPISLGTIEMCKIGNYQDYLYKQNGSWYVHKEIRKVVFDGSESWVLSSLGAGRFYLEISPIFKMISGTARGIKPYSSHFVGKDNSLDFENGKVVLMTSSYGGITHYFTRFENDNTPTLSEWKTWLSNNNVKLYYVLATPTEEEITNTTLIEQLEAIANAKSVKDKTYITQTNDDLPFILDVEAIKEYEVN